MFSLFQLCVFQVDYTSGFGIDGDVHGVDAAKDHDNERNIVVLLVEPSDHFPKTQSGRYPPESTSVAAGTSGERDKPQHLLYDFGGAVEQVGTSASVG